MILSPKLTCDTYHSVYAKYQKGDYAKLFVIDPNPQNQYFVRNQWDQSKCYGTKAICFDTKYGALTPTNMSAPEWNRSLRAQALRNQQLRTIMNGRPESIVWEQTGSVPVRQTTDVPAPSASATSYCCSCSTLR